MYCTRKGNLRRDGIQLYGTNERKDAFLDLKQALGPDWLWNVRFSDTLRLPAWNALDALILFPHTEAPLATHLLEIWEIHRAFLARKASDMQCQLWYSEAFKKDCIQLANAFGYAFRETLPGWIAIKVPPPDETQAAWLAETTRAAADKTFAEPQHLYLAAACQACEFNDYCNA
jgi:hypothetical protein